MNCIVYKKIQPHITFLYHRYEVYRGYIVFAFSLIMFVCLSVCLRVGVIKIVIVLNCNLITFSKVIACNCN